MKIVPVTQVGRERPLCTFKIRLAEGLKTNSAQFGAFERKRKGIPVDECGKTGDFLVDGDPRCRAHAGQAALRYLVEQPA